MRFPCLDDELDSICREYDYGIVPGSATVFVRDKTNNSGQLDLTLLEGIMVVVDVSEEGYMVTSCTQIISEPKVMVSLKLVQDYLEHSFDTMEKLLMTISPLFAQRLLERLQSSMPPSALTELNQTLLDVSKDTVTDHGSDINGIGCGSSFEHFTSVSTASTATTAVQTVTSAAALQSQLQSSPSPTSSSNHYDIFDWIH